MYYVGKRVLYTFFVGRAMFLQEWAMVMNMNVPLIVLSISADCGQGLW